VKRDLCILNTVVFVLASMGAFQAQVLVQDGEFAPFAWEHEVVSSGAGNWSAYGIAPSGGIPDAYLLITNQVTSAGFVRSLFFAPEVAWDPRIDGPIHAVEYSEDTLMISGFGQGQRGTIVVKQSGTIYESTVPYHANGSSWTHNTLGPLGSQGFSKIQGNGPAQPDFGEAGTPVQFGFQRGNSGGGLAYTLIAAADNIRISLQEQRPTIRQITDRLGGGGPCTNDCCGIDHRQPMLNSAGTEFVFSSLWNRDDLAGDLNPEANREVFRHLIDSNQFVQCSVTAEGLSVPYDFFDTNLLVVSSASDFGSNSDANVDVFSLSATNGSIVQVSDTEGPAVPIQGTDCPPAWFSSDLWEVLPNIHPDFSGNGKRAVWASNRNIPTSVHPAGNNLDRNYEIFLKDLASSDLKQLTETLGGDDVTTASGANLWPRGDHTGDNVVFVSNRPLGSSPITTGRYGLFMRDSTGDIRRLSNVALQVERDYPPFSMDDAGSTVVFAWDGDPVGQNPDANLEVFTMSIASQDVVQLTDTVAPVANYRPVLSGDGLKIAFVSDGDLAGGNQDGSEELWVYHFHEDKRYRSPFLQLTDFAQTPVANGGRSHWLDWQDFSHSGSKLVFCSNADPVGQNTEHAYEIFLVEFEWLPKVSLEIIAFSATEENRQILQWTAPGANMAYTVESTSDLFFPEWTPVAPTTQWPIGMTVWTNILEDAFESVFFRVRAE